jgi:hypothetical protein
MREWPSRQTHCPKVGGSADREGEMRELMQYAQAQEHPADWLLRALFPLVGDDGHRPYLTFHRR